MFEAFAIHVLQAASSVDRARTLLNLSWDAVHRILERAVERGLAVRDLDGVTRVGIDEKSFRRGQSYVSVLSDHDGNRVIEVVEGRDEKAVNGIWEAFSEKQKLGIEAVAMDMWQAFENSASANLPHADIVHDRFHIMKHLNDAVDQVRRGEHKELKVQGDDTLTGTKYWWLSNPDNLSDSKWMEFKDLKDRHLKTARAWAIREQFGFFWSYTQSGWARKFFKQWYCWASRCQLAPVRKKAKMIHDRLENILTYFKHRITNGPAEGFNSRIQSLKSSARGFRNYANYRVRILFFCGGLELLPEGQSH
jgi:transposase